MAKSAEDVTRGLVRARGSRTLGRPIATSLDEIHDAGNHVIARTRWITTGKDSGIDFETRFWAVFTLSAGKVARIEWFLDRSRALEAAGLLEKGTRTDST